MNAMSGAKLTTVVVLSVAMSVAIALTFGAGAGLRHPGGAVANVTSPDLSISGLGCEFNKCELFVGSEFTVDVSLESFKPLFGYTGFRILLDLPQELIFKGSQTVFICGPGAFPPPGDVGCLLEEEVTMTGSLAAFDFTCPATESLGNTITLVHGYPSGSYMIDGSGDPWPDNDPDEELTVNCKFAFPWDVNGDGTVSVGDIAAVVSAFGQSIPPAPPRTDVTGDGAISVEDIAVVVLHFGESQS